MEKDTNHARIMFPPPMLFLGFLIGALVLNWLFPLPEPWTTILRIAGGAAVVSGLLLGGAAISRMRRAHTSPGPDRPTTALVTEGPYRFTRNPIYLGFLLIYLGFTLMAGTLWGLVLSPILLWIATRAIIRAEEAYLAERFPDDYEAYKARVRRWL
jgi:protein-S-isoprenylcysteine O-methyltransferase Ste14